MLTDGKLAVIFFEAGIVLTLISMVLGPFEITDPALAAASIACVCALAGMVMAFESWKEPEITQNSNETEEEKEQL